MMNTREEFEKWLSTPREKNKEDLSWNPWIGWQACQEFNDARLAELEEKLRLAEMDAENMILAEREACAMLLDSDADRLECEWNEYLASGKQGPATSLHSIPRGYADAIRKRSNN